MNHFELRSQAFRETPTFIVTEVKDDGTGEDVAWFYSLVRAQQYRDWMNEKEQLRKGFQVKHSRHD